MHLRKFEQPSHGEPFKHVDRFHEIQFRRGFVGVFPLLHVWCPPLVNLQCFFVLASGVLKRKECIETSRSLPLDTTSLRGRLVQDGFVVPAQFVRSVLTPFLSRLLVYSTARTNIRVRIKTFGLG